MVGNLATFFGLLCRTWWLGKPKVSPKGSPKAPKRDPKMTENRSKIHPGSPWHSLGCQGVPPRCLRMHIYAYLCICCAYLCIFLQYCCNIYAYLCTYALVLCIFMHISCIFMHILAICLQYLCIFMHVFTSFMHIYAYFCKRHPYLCIFWQYLCIFMHMTQNSTKLHSGPSCCDQGSQGVPPWGIKDPKTTQIW